MVVHSIDIGMGMSSNFNNSKLNFFLLKLVLA